MSHVPLMQSPPGPETVIDGKKYLYFGGTSYLGLAGRPEVIEAGCQAMQTYGVHSATSRSRIGTIPPVVAVEQRAAEFFGTEDAFYFASGYSSNHIMVSALTKDADLIVVDAAAHYCVLEASRLANLPVNKFCRGAVPDLVETIGSARRPLVMIDGVCASTGRLAPVQDYLDALKNYEDAALLLDDAHGFGVVGNNGRGILDELGLWENVNSDGKTCGVRLHVCGTLAKAIGGFGGIIPGTREFVQRTRKSSHYFDGASAPASAEAGATAAALSIVMNESELRTRVRKNSTQLRSRLRQLGLRVPEGHTAHFGVEIGDAKNMIRIHDSLKSKNIILPYVGSYSGIPTEGLLRFAVFANHTGSQIDKLISELRSIV